MSCPSEEYPASPTGEPSPPPAPDDLRTLALPPAYVQTNSDECFLLWDSQYDAVHRRTLLFGTVDCMDLLVKADHVVVDGTFKVAPQLFYQLLSRRSAP